jgi:hypothetical protein
MKCLSSLFFFLLGIQLSFGQSVPNQSKLKLSEIMKGNSFVGHQPTNIRWTIDSKKIVFDWNPYDQPGNSTYAYDIGSQELDSVTLDFYLKYGLDTKNKNDKYAVYTVNGDLYCYYFDGALVKRIIKSKDRIKNVHYSPLKELFYFQVSTDLFSFDPASNSISQLAHFKKGQKKSDEELNTLQTEELNHFEYLEEEKKNQEWKKKNDIFGKDL